MKYTTHTSSVRNSLRNSTQHRTVESIVSLTVNNGCKRITRDGFEAYNGKHGFTHKCERPAWMDVRDWFIANMPENDEVLVDQLDK